MEELLFGAVIMWALGRVAKKKADAPAPGKIDLPPQERTMGNLYNYKRR
jgi:cbb3-type cytochrome oxidase subunit 3